MTRADPLFIKGVPRVIFPPAELIEGNIVVVWVPDCENERRVTVTLGHVTYPLMLVSYP